MNAISSGPIRTLAASGVSGFKTMYKHFTNLAPLQQNVTSEDIGNTAVFLCSDMAAKITGEVLFVDSGYNIMGLPILPAGNRIRSCFANEPLPNPLQPPPSLHRPSGLHP